MDCAVDKLASELSNSRIKPESATSSKDQGSFDISLEGAKYGEVVTRFPPEPSGYLHIGHAKAALLNEYFARMYGGKLIIRFDDTNPLKEKMEFETSIIEDLALLGVRGDILSYTSDYFDQLIEFAFKLIDHGLAYADDTPQETMRQGRFSGIASARRETSADESKAIFERMIRGDDDAQVFCIRAKMSVDSPNKALRDPVIYRCCVEMPHHRTGSKYKVYPTYDFACPIVDSIEGVTHALRTNEYHDRNDQYYWFIQALGLRRPFIWDYSRLNFVYTLLSKRKLNLFVNSGIVSGWDDPRFPTVRGILRRGLTLSALKHYILMQGASKNSLLLEWDKLWAINKKVIDPMAHRYTALTDPVSLIIEDGPLDPQNKEINLHPKNPEFGTKNVCFSSNLLISHQDAKDLSVGEEITLMKWGNLIVTRVAENTSDSCDGKLCIFAKLNLDGSVKDTKKKITWISKSPCLASIQLLDYDFLITKKKLEENDKLEDFITPKSEFVMEAVGEPAMSLLKVGDIIQLERLGFYIVDSHSEDAAGNTLRLIFIPDGKVKTVSSKATGN
ncbi:glutamate--tRNA ligase [Mitosporidium daphniae]|uniref:Probable glutamate--tRNA ligase, cytoplasmic n=1 Tax=Mitosporidium daphniae TaxID=1485682 RepID=A0A098VST1_9MICR|nr:uncharacterized protein DI09_21p70 [Mitosporidium daphniae]KGG52035.1 hypothetical protein DI09_21p70 [Mitosporidium daphniae]|eukprot:XP_013238492.1 uncharacterized protein DI09_21p70 [Mitosporidium daphniae]